MPLGAFADVAANGYTFASLPNTGFIYAGNDVLLKESTSGNDTGIWGVWDRY